MIRDLDIVRARIYAVTPANTPPYRWTGQDGFVRITDNLLSPERNAPILG